MADYIFPFNHPSRKEVADLLGEFIVPFDLMREAVSMLSGRDDFTNEVMTARLQRLEAIEPLLTAAGGLSEAAWIAIRHIERAIAIIGPAADHAPVVKNLGMALDVLRRANDLATMSADDFHADIEAEQYGEG